LINAIVLPFGIGFPTGVVIWNFGGTDTFATIAWALANPAPPAPEVVVPGDDELLVVELHPTRVSANIMTADSTALARHPDQDELRIFSDSLFSLEPTTRHFRIAAG
jgi:hypothetical protein